MPADALESATGIAYSEGWIQGSGGYLSKGVVEGGAALQLVVDIRVTGPSQMVMDFTD
jgi:hypothetical protein